MCAVRLSIQSQGVSVVHRCLVVDDSRVMRKVARAIFESFELDTAEAEGADAALAFCRETMPQVIMLNLNLPHPDGVQFVRHLRREQNGKKVFVMFATTENDVSRIADALSAGANDYVMKPFDREAIQAKLASAGLI
jgi:two-component system chemotaxis response regulator CheY